VKLQRGHNLEDVKISTAGQLPNQSAHAMRDLPLQVLDYFDFRWPQQKYFCEKEVLDDLSPGLKVR
jgi:hypothetical protein